MNLTTDDSTGQTSITHTSTGTNSDAYTINTDASTTTATNADYEGNNIRENPTPLGVILPPHQISSVQHQVPVLTQAQAQAQAHAHAQAQAQQNIMNLNSSFSFNSNVNTNTKYPSSTFNLNTNVPTNANTDNLFSLSTSSTPTMSTTSTFLNPTSSTLNNLNINRTTTPLFPTSLPPGTPLFPTTVPHNMSYFSTIPSISTISTAPVSTSTFTSTVNLADSPISMSDETSDDKSDSSDKNGKNDKNDDYKKNNETDESSKSDGGDDDKDNNEDKEDEEDEEDEEYEEDEDNNDNEDNEEDNELEEYVDETTDDINKKGDQPMSDMPNMSDMSDKTKGDKLAIKPIEGIEKETTSSTEIKTKDTHTDIDTPDVCVKTKGATSRDGNIAQVDNIDDNVGNVSTIADKVITTSTTTGTITTSSTPQIERIEKNILNDISSIYNYAIEDIEYSASSISLESRLLELERRYVDKCSLIQSLQLKNKILTNDAQHLESKYSSSEKSKQIYTDDIDVLQSKYTILENEMNKISRISRLTHDNNEDLKSKIHTLTQRNRELTAELQEKTTLYSRYEVEANNAQSQVNTLQSQNAILEKQMIIAQGQVDEIRLQFREELANNSTKLTQMHVKCDTLVSEKRDLQARFDARTQQDEDKIAKYSLDIQQLQKKYDLVVAEKERVLAKLASESALVSALQRDREQIQATLAQQRQQYELLQEEKNRIVKEFDEMGKRYDELMNEKVDRESKIRALLLNEQNMRNEKERIVLAMDQDFADLKTKLEQKENTVAELELKHKAIEETGLLRVINLIKTDIHQNTQENKEQRENNIPEDPLSTKYTTAGDNDGNDLDVDSMTDTSSTPSLKSTSRINIPYSYVVEFQKENEVMTQLLSLHRVNKQLQSEKWQMYEKIATYERKNKNIQSKLQEITAQSSRLSLAHSASLEKNLKLQAKMVETEIHTKEVESKCDEYENRIVVLQSTIKDLSTQVRALLKRGVSNVSASSSSSTPSMSSTSNLSTLSALTDHQHDQQITQYYANIHSIDDMQNELEKLSQHSRSIAVELEKSRASENIAKKQVERMQHAVTSLHTMKAVVEKLTSDREKLRAMLEVVKERNDDAMKATSASPTSSISSKATHIQQSLTLDSIREMLATPLPTASSTSNLLNSTDNVVENTNSLMKTFSKLQEQNTSTSSSTTTALPHLQQAIHLAQEDLEARSSVMLVQVESRLRLREDEITSLRSRLQTLEHDYTTSKSEHSTLEKKYNELHKNTIDSTHEWTTKNNLLLSQLEQTEFECNRIRNELQTYEANTRVANTRISTLENRITQLDQELLIQKDNLRIQDNNYVKLETVHAETVKDKDILRTEYQLAQSNYTILKERNSLLVQSEQNLQQRIYDLETRIQKQEETFQLSLTSVNDVLTRETTTKQALVDENVDLRAKMGRLQGEYDDLMSKNMENAKENTEVIVKLQSQVKVFEDEVERIKYEKKNLEIEKDSLEQKVVTYRHRIEEIESRFSKLVAATTSASHLVVGGESGNNRGDGTGDSVTSATTKAPSSSTEKAYQSGPGKITKITTIGLHGDDLDLFYNLSPSTGTNTDADVNTSNTTSPSVIIDVMELVELVKARDRVIEAENQQDILNEKQIFLQHELDSTQSSLATLELSLQHTIESNRVKIEEMETYRSTTEPELKSLRDRLDRLTQTNEKLDDINKKCDQQIEKLLREAADLRRNLETVQEKCQVEIREINNERITWKESIAKLVQDSEESAKRAMDASMKYQTELIAHGETAKMLSTLREKTEYDAKVTWKSLQDANIKLEAELDKKKIQIEELRKNEKVSMEEMEKYRLKIRQFENRYLTTIKRNVPSDDTDTDADADIDTIAEIKRLKDICEYLRSEKSLLEGDLLKSRQDMSRMKHELEEKMQEILQLQVIIETNKASGITPGITTTATSTTTPEYLDELQSQFNLSNMSKIQDVARQLVLTMESNEHLRFQLQTANKNITHLQEELESQINARIPLDSQISTLLSSEKILKQKTQSLSDEIALWRDRNTQLLGKYNQIDFDIHQQVVTERDNLLEKNEEKNEQLSLLQDEYTKLKKIHDDTIVNVQILKADLTLANSELKLLRDIKNQNDKLQTDLREYQQKENENNIKLKTLTSQSQAEIHQLQTQIHTLQTLSKQTQKLQNLCVEFEKNAQNSVRVRNTLENTIRELQSIATISKNKLQEKDEQIVKLQERCTNLTTALDTSSDTSDKYVAEYQQIQDTVTDMQIIIDENTAMIEKYKNEIQQLHINNNKYVQKINDIEGDIKLYQDQLLDSEHAYQQSVEQSNQQIEKLQQQLKSAANQNDLFKQELLENQKMQQRKLEREILQQKLQLQQKRESETDEVETETGNAEVEAEVGDNGENNSNINSTIDDYIAEVRSRSRSTSRPVSPVKRVLEVENESETEPESEKQESVLYDDSINNNTHIFTNSSNKRIKTQHSLSDEKEKDQEVTIEDETNISEVSENIRGNDIDIDMVMEPETDVVELSTTGENEMKEIEDVKDIEDVAIAENNNDSSYHQNHNNNIASDIISENRSTIDNDIDTNTYVDQPIDQNVDDVMFEYEDYLNDEDEDEDFSRFNELLFGEQFEEKYEDSDNNVSPNLGVDGGINTETDADVEAGEYTEQPEAED